MSIGQNSIDLWKRSPPWRAAVVCATVATVLAFVSGAPSQQLAGSAGTQGTTPSTGSPLQTAGNQTVPPSQQCGPQGMLSLQAPIVVSSTGAVPTNVQGVAASAASDAGIPASVLSRFRQFFTRVDAANLEQRLGERCVRMEGALTTLEANDYAYADCFQDGQQKLVAAQSCDGDFDASEKRFDRLITAYTASKTDTSAVTIEELARARERMLPFDETRERWGTSDAAVAAGDQAISTIQASDRRIAVLEAAGSKRTSTLEEIESLAAAAEITALDRSRLSVQAREALTRAEQAKSELAASDLRLAAVGDAFQGDTTASALKRSDLISALSSLTELDLSRASTAQVSLVEQARLTASKYALADLVDAVKGVDLAALEPEDLSRIQGLATAAREFGGAAATDLEAKNALAVADQATDRLEQSNRRIVALNEMVMQVEAGGPSALNDEVLRVYDAITEFDIKRMSDKDAQALARLEEARNITLASRKGDLTHDVPIYLWISSSDDLSALALSEVKRELENQGFKLVEAVERAAIEMRLELSAPSEKAVNLQGSRLNTVELTLAIVGRWTVANNVLPIPTVEGSAAGSDLLSLSREAVSKAARSAAVEISNLVEP